MKFVDFIQGLVTGGDTAATAQHIISGVNASLQSIEDRLGPLEQAVADLHAALSDKPSPAAVQQAVADVTVPQPGATPDA